MGKHKREIQTILVESELHELWENREDRRAAQNMWQHEKDLRIGARIQAISAANSIVNRGYGFEYIFDTDSDGNTVELSTQEKNNQILTETLRVAESALAWIIAE